MVVLGLALGAAQLIPLYELVRQSFREGAASLQQVRDWAWPSPPDHHLPAARLLRQSHRAQLLRHLAARLGPGDAERPGRTAEHDRLGREELRRRRQLPGAADVAAGRGGRGRCAVAEMAAEQRSRGEEESKRRRRRSRGNRLLPRRDCAAASLCSSSWRCSRCSSPSARRSMRCSTTLLPGYSQLHSAFRWVFPYTLSMAVLAGYGLDAVVAGVKGQG